MERDLTPKQALFVGEYMKDFNGAEAVTRAGYKTRYPGKVAYQLLEIPRISKEIEQRRTELAQRAKLTAEQWIDRVRKLAFYDPRKLFDSHGNPIEIAELDEETALSIAGFEIVEDFTKVKKAGGGEDAVQTGYTKKFKLLDRTPYIIALGKVLGVFPDARRKEKDPYNGNPRYDLSKLTDDELKLFKALRDKAKVRQVIDLPRE
jgi:phage terminase small subunit